MAGSSLGRQTIWQYSHAATIFSSVLLFTAGFLCVLLWTNNIVHTDTSTADTSTSTFTQFSPAVSTFSITYNVAIFGIAWNAVLFVALLVLEREALPLSTARLRYEVEKAAVIVAITGNTAYATACMALMSTLARLAADASADVANPQVASSANARRAGQGVTAAVAGIAGATALLACYMDIVHAQNSQHRRVVKDEPLTEKIEAEKQA